MKKTAWVAAALVVAVGFASFEIESSNGRAGYTNSPGESNCTNCHDNFAVNSGAGSVAISSNPSLAGGYIPGATYAMTVTVSDNAPNNTLFGFGLEALNGSGANGGTLTITNPTLTQIKTFMVSPNLRNNVVHTGNGNTGPNTQPFSFNWTAPAAGAGTITFYASGLGSDNDGGTDGDYVYTTSMAAPEQVIVCDPPTNTASGNLTPTTARLHWTKYKVLHSSSWVIKRTKNNWSYKMLTGLTPNTTYQWKVRSLCMDNPKVWSAWTAPMWFTTPVVSPARLNAGWVESDGLVVFPSPATDVVHIAASDMKEGISDVGIYNLLGELKHRVESGRLPLQVDVSDWLPGIYIVRARTAQGILQEKFVKR